MSNNPTVVNPNDTHNTVEAQLELLDGDDKKTIYLSWRVAGFTVSESCELAKCHRKSVQRWREEDPKFLESDTEGLTPLRELIRNKFLYSQFARNLQLFLQTDFDVIMKSRDKGRVLTEQEQAYLLKVRGMYTPQQLGILSELLNPTGDKTKEFNFSKFTLTLRKEREEMTIQSE